MGEAIVGYAGVYLIVELRNADGQPVKNGLVSKNGAKEDYGVIFSDQDSN